MGVVVGGQLCYQFQFYFVFRFQGFLGDFVGNDRNNRGIVFCILFIEGSILLEWYFLQYEYYILRWFFYFGLGIGLIFFELRVDFFINWQEGSFFEGVEVDIQADKGSLQWVIFGCLGFNFVMNDYWELGAEVNLCVSFFDYLDGVSQVVNLEFSDWYLIIILLLIYIWGEIDCDGDGILDEFDCCLDQFGNVKFQGCLDIDNDGIFDFDDVCFNQFGYFDGCFDSDIDGVLDFIDQCFYCLGLLQQVGCLNMDIDVDGVLDEEDKCLECFGLLLRVGCLLEDIDYDGIIDEYD